MKKPLPIVFGVLLLVALGFGAYSLGVMVRGEPELRGTELEEPVPVGDITLQSSAGEQVSLADFAGDYTLVFFGYSNCPDVCPLTMARLGSIYRSLGEPERLQVVMITVDPERDTPEVIDRYAKGFHEDFVGLGGSAERIDAAAERFFIAHNEDGQGGVLHGSQVLLVDPQGRYWRIYNDSAQGYLEEDLRRLI